MSSRRVIQLISFSWGLCVIFILVLSSLLFSLDARVVLRTLFWLVFVLFYFLPCVMIIFCFARMIRVIYMQNRAPTFSGKQLRFKKRREKSALIMMMIVVFLFLVLCGINIRCIFAVLLNDKCDRGKYRDLILVLNSAVNPLAYAFFKADLKREIKKDLLQERQWTCRWALWQKSRLNAASTTLKRWNTVKKRESFKISLYVENLKMSTSFRSKASVSRRDRAKFWRRYEAAQNMEKRHFRIFSRLQLSLLAAKPEE